MMTQERVVELLNIGQEAAILAEAALERADKSASLKHLRACILATRAAMDGLASLPNGAHSLSEMEPALAVYENAEKAAERGDFSGALHGVSGR